MLAVPAVSLLQLVHLSATVSQGDERLHVLLLLLLLLLLEDALQAGQATHR